MVDIPEKGGARIPTFLYFPPTFPFFLSRPERKYGKNVVLWLMSLLTNMRQFFEYL